MVNLFEEKKRNGQFTQANFKKFDALPFIFTIVVVLVLSELHPFLPTTRKGLF